jgi:hypothetical protein
LFGGLAGGVIDGAKGGSAERTDLFVIHIGLLACERPIKRFRRAGVPLRVGVQDGQKKPPEKERPEFGEETESPLKTSAAAIGSVATGSMTDYFRDPAVEGAGQRRREAPCGASRSNCSLRRLRRQRRASAYRPRE